MDLKTLEFSFKKDIGEIGEKKSQKLNNILKDKYPVKEEIAPGLLLINKNKKKHLIITKNQISLEFNEITNDFDFNKDIKDVVEIIFESIILENRAKAISNKITFLKESKDPFGESISKFNNEGPPPIKENLKGVGYRFLLEEELGHREIKIEPFLKQKGFWYVEQILVCDKSVDDVFNYLDNIKKEIEGFKDKYSSLFSYYINNE